MLWFGTRRVAERRIHSRARRAKSFAFRPVTPGPAGDRGTRTGRRDARREAETWPRSYEVLSPFPTSGDSELKAVIAVNTTTCCLRGLRATQAPREGDQSGRRERDAA